MTGTLRRREDDVPFDVDVVARGGHAVDAMALGCDRRGRAQADEHEEESEHHRRRGRWRGRREEGRRWRAVPGRRSIIMIVLVYVPCPWMVNLTSTVDRR